MRNSLTRFICTAVGGFAFEAVIDVGNVNAGINGRRFAFESENGDLPFGDRRIRERNFTKCF